MLKPSSEATLALHWWHTFKPQPKSICRPLVEEIVTSNAFKEGYRGYINNLSFRGRWHIKKGRNTNINMLELETLEGLSKV